MVNRVLCATIWVSSMGKEQKKLTDPQLVSPQEARIDRSLRPTALDEYIGQQKIRNQLSVFIQAARRRKESLDHVLLFGPPGLGKTTLANIIANEMGASIHSTSGPALERLGDIAAMITGIERGDMLFIDEIHRMHPAIEEALYPALEDFRFDIMVGNDGPGRHLKLELEPFTMVGATTRAGMLTSPLRERFGIVLRLDFYNETEMCLIVSRSAKILGVPTTEDGVAEIARRSRSTPRIANRLLRRVRDFAEVQGDGVVTGETARNALEMLAVDVAGLDGSDKAYLEALVHRFGGGPVGVENLAIAVGEPSETLESFIEPFLIKEGYVMRTPRGRVATPLAQRHCGLPNTGNTPHQNSTLWDDVPE